MIQRAQLSFICLGLISVENRDQTRRVHVTLPIRDNDITLLRARRVLVCETVGKHNDNLLCTDFIGRNGTIFNIYLCVCVCVCATVISNSTKRVIKLSVVIRGSAHRFVYDVYTVPERTNYQLD